MGHVDHGKTTLLDALRNTAVAAGEAGGITQHIGAFSVPLKLLQPGTKSDATITFLDTPGHAAFTAMRARGASVTDIVVLVVAADDGVMPQTKEVLELVKSEGDKVGLVVAINKVDKPEIDLKRVKNELLQEGVHLEEDGGDVQSVQVSGLARLGLDNLVETLSTLAELRDLRARTGGKAEGYVLESNVDRGIGRVATVLVTRGTLKVGSVVVAGNTSCKVRRMTDHTGKTIKSAGPGTPVVITGWKEIPSAGDELLEAPGGEREAAKVVANRIALADRQKLLADTEVINVKRQEDRAKLEAEQEAEKAVRQSGGNVTEARLAASKRAAADARENTFKELRIVIKGDVSGTVEAVEGALSGIGNKEAGVRVVHTGVGEVTDSDVAMAEASGGELVGQDVADSSHGNRFQRALLQEHQDFRDAKARGPAPRVGHLPSYRDGAEEDRRALAAHD
jgi:translation initiation factor IF-2